MEQKNKFSSKLGFVLAAAGSAVGIGNIWGFPTQAASQGGGAFLCVYMVLIFILGYPMLVAELAIGRFGQSNPVDALRRITPKPPRRKMATLLGLSAVVTVSLILSFYAIVAGWFVAWGTDPILRAFGAQDAAQWVVGLTDSSQLFFTLLFIAMTGYIVNQGVQKGIELWSRRLMPALFLLLIGLAGYMFTQPGAMIGLQEYLIPRFDRVLDPQVLLSATGQTFFSLSLGAGVMMVYGAYLDRKASIPSVAFQVTCIDSAIAFLAGLLILPAMYVAQNLGVTIFAEDGSLLSADTLVLRVLPALFANMGPAEYLLSPFFFMLMLIAAITSSVSMLEASVSLMTSKTQLTRGQSVMTMVTVLSGVSALIVLNMQTLFGLIITITTSYAQPLVSLGVTLYAGWLWQRHKKLQELGAHDAAFEQSLFWRLWSPYVRYVCPVLVLVVFYHATR